VADEPLNGTDFRALRRLSTKDDVTLAEIGETCERVPVASLAPLLASGKIERIVTEPVPRRKAPR
jgi:hypothetical protein